MNSVMIEPTFPTVVNAVILTAHARLRMAQRNLSRKDIVYTMNYGRRYHRAGVVHVHLRHKDIPHEDLADNSVARLEGVTVVVSRDEPVVLTVWRNRDSGSRHIRRKQRYGRSAKSCVLK